MSKQDTHFFNMFSLVLGILIAIAIGLFAYARHVGSTTQVEHLKSEDLRVAAVDQRTQPIARVAIAGKDNSALAIVEPKSNAAPAAAAALPKTGEDVYKTACSTCHSPAMAAIKAPKFGDAAAWGPRVAKGKATLYKHALEGFQGPDGVMPPKGGRMDLSDDLIRAGVDYMTDGSR